MPNLAPKCTGYPHPRRLSIVYYMLVECQPPKWGFSAYKTLSFLKVLLYKTKDKYAIQKH